MSTPTIAELDRRHGIAGTAQVVEGQGGLPKVSVTAPDASGEMYLLGGHVTSWRPTSRQEVLFVSAATRWEQGKAIRGGIPICFPWFGNKADDPKAPAHGFVRAESWQLESIARAGNAVTVSMFTESDSNSRKLWPCDFRLTHRVTFGSELRLELEMVNTGNTTLQFEEALHTYFKVGDISGVRVHGLDGVHYLDKTDSFREKTQSGDVSIAKETDSVYLDTAHAVDLEDPVLHRRIHVAKENSRSTVVWNPWVEKARAMSDFGDDEWKQMACIEAANVGKFAVTLGSGARHVTQAVIRITEA